MRTGRVLFIISILLIFACSLLFIFSEPIFKQLANGLVVDERIQKSDAVLVLGGGSPSRVLEAIDIYNEGFAEKILITRGGRPEGSEYLESKGIKFPEGADLNKFVAEKLGINNKDLVLLPGRVYSTREEAILIKDFALKKGYVSIIVTTSKSHSRRARLIFDRLFKNTGIKIIISPSKYDSFDPDNLKINKNHWKRVVLEYEKLVYYYATEIF